ncbi:MAG: hypothetical protein RI949_651 [Pseudomonadota bacterium]
MGRAAPDSSGLTARLVAQSLALRFGDLPLDVRRVARDCVVDWLACTLAGLSEPVSGVVAEAATDEGSHAQASFVGRRTMGSVQQAALVNGTASHALDYDDVNLCVPGHMTVAILPAVLALAEHHGVDGAQVLASFTAGYEFACRIGRLVEPAHYANGFHATATIGCLGAAVACGHLLQLGEDRTCHAVGVAATQAAGMKAMFGTMAKPLHAGLAARAGLQSALWAAKGFTSRTDAIECGQGFAALHGQDFRLDDALATPSGGFHLLSNLFKFHAACYSTHATIEAVSALRQSHGLKPADLDQIHVVAGEGCTICNIPSPTTHLEAKFSLRATAAFAMLGIDTSGLQAWGRVVDPDVVAVRDKVVVELVPSRGLSDAQVTVHMRDGAEWQLDHDCGIPQADKQAQSLRVADKFCALAGPVVGAERTEAIMAMMSSAHDGFELAPLIHLCAVSSDEP